MSEPGTVQQNFGRKGVEARPGEVRGIRRWMFYGGNLIGMMGTSWRPGAEMQSSCLSLGGRNSHNFDYKCTCGFYAYWGDAYARKPPHYYSIYETIGVVSGYGKVAIGSLGFRCEKSRILAVTIHPRLPGTAKRYLESSGIAVYSDLVDLLGEFPCENMY